MSLLELLAVALGLSMDAFAVSIAEGMIVRQVTPSHTARVAVHFGAFQGLMPLLGYAGGAYVQSFISTWDHWVAFGLLIALGVKMLADAALGFETHEPRGPASGLRLIGLSIATSVDALAVGVTLGLLHAGIWLPAAIIGLVTGAVCAVGVQLGDRLGPRLGRWAEVLGGLTLAAIGIRILWLHMR